MAIRRPPPTLTGKSIAHAMAAKPAAMFIAQSASGPSA